MNTSGLVLIWAAIAALALLVGPLLALKLQVWIATALAGIAALICFIRLVH
jgi:hypothetical protein